ncbi:cytosolic phospholipase A2 gamma-like [Megalobrama amblycephala]|uniref:cytosolic phospholipase A2 gamma-like n=1 Tax=Megalobrama amblycephala TaxID=75352 RepID=UPI002013C534|nr:cytosolic phospholipase A2 gamma-like isoform X1 [Megalobrama amblycephala]XP_048036519.1 cytosolic phospholipase A2 gamma-like isoform X1 [Megalobrama amblycephala]XP_048042702.1 cytosolic phospholipase A2 gamma-like [Megalobrama amblycephala]
MSASKPQESGEVRIEPSLNKNEAEFIDGRRKSVLQSLKKLQIKCSQDEVPNIALLGSGGGQRAMVGLLGSLVQLQKTGLLDSILYLSGVSGSTWCMASVYQEPDWSTKLETVKNKIIKRLSGPEVSWKEAFAKLKKYYYGKDHFSLTDIWAVMVITSYVKEIDEHTLTEQWSQQSKDGKVPFPIYTVIDKKCKQRNIGDPWFEITPHEAGYSLTGAFVDASNFGSKFHKGSKKNQQDEFDMLYLQALCGSALADEVEIKKLLWQKIKDFFQHKETILKDMGKEPHERRLEALARESGTGSEEVFAAGFKPGTREVLLHPLSERRQQDPNAPATEECYQVLMNLVDMNLSVLTGKDPSAFDESIRTSLNDLSGGKIRVESLRISDKKAEKLNMKSYTMDVINNFRGRIGWPFELSGGQSHVEFPRLSAWTSIIKCMNHWTWGRNYNFLHDMTGEAVPSTLQETETRDYEDAGLLLNSPYFSVLRKERDIDLIISLDFSEGDPFMTVKEAAKMCKELNIPFPEVNIPSEDLQKPKDFYVFKGKNTPTVIHIPLFNMVNCGDKIEAKRKSYKTFQGPYSAEMITDLMEVAGKNITNNRGKLVEQIRAAVGQKGSRR